MNNQRVHFGFAIICLLCHSSRVSKNAAKVGRSWLMSRTLVDDDKWGWYVYVWWSVGVVADAVQVKRCLNVETSRRTRR